MFQLSRRMVIAGLAASLALGSLAACGDNGSDDADASAATRSVTHDNGTTEVPAEPKRIVSLSVTLTGHLLALDAPVVASQVSRGPFSDKAGFFRQYSAEAAEKKVRAAYVGTEVDLEKVVGFKPDLIIGSMSGADSTLKVYDQVKDIAPTLLYRYDNVSWQDMTRKLGDAIGLKDNATKLLSEFDTKLNTVKSAIKVPATEVAPVRDNDTEIVFFTAKSAQGQLLESLGFKVREVPANVRSGTGNEGGAREDILTVSRENLPPALGTASLLFIGHTPAQITAAQAKTLWASTPAVKEKRVHDLGLDTFRMDYFSATLLLDRLEKQFA